jgi:hypothetical protein
LIPLPKGLVINRDHLEQEKEFLTKVRAYLESEDRAEGVHVSDLLDERLACYRKLTKSPIPERLLNVFMVGKVLHGIVHLTSTGKNESDSGSYEAEGILFSPDDATKEGYPIEDKTTRSQYPPKTAYLPDDQTYHMYMEQLLSYMALRNQSVGLLRVLYLNLRDESGKTSPTIYIWRVETSSEALAAMRKVLGEKKARLLKALEEKDPRQLPLCRKWKCRDCEFWSDCKPEGRYGLPEKEWIN